MAEKSQHPLVYICPVFLFLKQNVIQHDGGKTDGRNFAILVITD